MRYAGLNILFICVLLSVGGAGNVYGQMPTDTLPKDPAALLVYTTQNLSFGAFAVGPSGGSISISPLGVRTATGSVVLVNFLQPSNAVFEFEAAPNVIVSFSSGGDVVLTGSNGGTMILKVTGADTDPVSPYVNQNPPPYRTQVKVGGTLVVGSVPATVPGNYTGNFYITFNQQ